MKKTKAIQVFSESKLEESKHLSNEDVLRFLNDFQKLQAGLDEKTKLISIRMPENLLQAFKLKAKAENRGYQTLMIKALRQFILG